MHTILKSSHSQPSSLLISHYLPNTLITGIIDYREKKKKEILLSNGEKNPKKNNKILNNTETISEKGGR